MPLVAARLAGRRIEAVRRRGKLVVFALDGGDALCTSLRMTGRFTFKELGDAAPEPFTRATFTFTDGASSSLAIDAISNPEPSTAALLDRPFPSGTSETTSRRTPAGATRPSMASAARPPTT